MSAADPGMVAVVRKDGKIICARIITAKEDRMQGHFWLGHESRWARVRSAFAPTDVLAILPENTAPDAINRSIANLQQRRHQERRHADQLFNKRLQRLLKRRMAL